MDACVMESDRFDSGSIMVWDSIAHGLKTRLIVVNGNLNAIHYTEKGKRKIQGVPQSQTAALPRHHEEEETDKSNQAQFEQTYKKH